MGSSVQVYSAALKSRMLRRLVGPQAISANALAQEVGDAQESLSRWLRASRNIGVRAPGSNAKKKWTGAERLRVVSEARGLSESELGAFLRREGLHEAEVTAWRVAAEAALSEAGRRAALSAEQRGIQEFERELRRNDAALAETAALLVLKKKCKRSGGDGDDSTAPRHES